MNEADCCPACGKSMVEVRYCPECRKDLVVMGVNHDPHGEHRLFARLAKHAAEKAGLKFLWLKSINYYEFEAFALVEQAASGETNARIAMAENSDFTKLPPWLRLRFDACEPAADMLPDVDPKLV